MSDKEFVDGLRVKPPNEKAPDFVKGTISIKREELLAWLSSRTEEWINVDIKVAKSGKWYAEANNWKPKGDSPSSKPDRTAPAGGDDGADFKDDDFPF